MLIGNRLTSNSDSQLLYFVEAAKEEEEEDGDDDMDGFQTDDEDEDDSGSDGEMGAVAEDGDEADSSKLIKLTDQVCGYDSEKNICIHILIKYMILSLSICTQYCLQFLRRKLY
jgi:hypothetical protein